MRRRRRRCVGLQLRSIAPTRGGGGSNGDGKRHGGRRGGVCGTLLMQTVCIQAVLVLFSWVLIST